MMKGESQIPTATYRLQLNRNFTFRDATEIVSYLSDLGVSHCYVSPYLRARTGSMHGYDIIDHNSLNPEIGTPEDYERFVAELHRQGMGQILDIVPNHMGIMGSDNAWWLDVLENGEASDYAQFFDIDWHPIKPELQDKVLVPILANQYGIVLEAGDLKLSFDVERGEFSISYHEHRFPLDPVEYASILNFRGEWLQEKLGASDDALELQSIATAFSHLPGRRGLTAEQRAERNREKEVQKRRLAALCARSSEIADFLFANVAAANGRPGDPNTYDTLHELIKAQAYRLAQWRVAADDINYRRFFDINDLAALCTENDAVFTATHQLVLELIAQGKVDGLRVDHPDGLYDPAKYFHQLKERITQGPQPHDETYIVAEKILTRKERLRKNWGIDGTSGYEFSNLVNGLFVNRATADKMQRIYRSFCGRMPDFTEQSYRCRKLILSVVLASELNVLANLLARIALSDRHTCDFTLNSLRRALAEIIASFPVYRTYVSCRGVSSEDRSYIEEAVAAGRKRSHAADLSVFDFIRSALLIEVDGHESQWYKRAVTRFAMKFQQVTAAVMAKGVEDTAFYRFNRLISLNEVGGDPEKFGTSIEDFHRANQERLNCWPHSMLSSSTHDSKRSEDVRARVDVLSEIPAEWRLRLRSWQQWNREKKRAIEGRAAPAQNDEYLLYQTLVGTWPSHICDEAAWSKFSERIEQYMLKAAREAKEHTNWTNPNPEYEAALTEFTRAVLERNPQNLFFKDFSEFHRRIARCGSFNSLSQCLLKLTSPGVPDIYQGNELWELSLADPDNRRPVNYAERKEQLVEQLRLDGQPSQALREYVRGLVTNLDDGRCKLFVTSKTLRTRRAETALFQRGTYAPLTVSGSRAAHIVAFAREYEGRIAVVAAPRLTATLLSENFESPCEPEVWADTSVEVKSRHVACYHNVFTGECTPLSGNQPQHSLQARELFRYFPVALLLGNP